MSKGKVKYFNDLKGWGFIAGEKTDENVYVHHSEILMDGFKTLREGQDVLFEVINTNNGLQAHNVTVIE